MSAEAVGRYMPPVVTLDDLAAMNAADRNGHRFRDRLARLGADGYRHEGARVCLGGDPAVLGRGRRRPQTVTLHRLAGHGGYEERARMPLAWLLRTAPAEHLD